jgi:hypothetical protein
MSPEAMPLAARLGDGSGVPKKDNRLNRFQSSRAREACQPSILVWHHYCNTGLRVVNVERAASGDEFHQTATLPPLRCVFS